MRGQALESLDVADQTVRDRFLSRVCRARQAPRRRPGATAARERGNLQHGFNFSSPQEGAPDRLLATSHFVGSSQAVRRWANPLFVVSTLVSAFALFLVQPFAARALLPRYGGAPAVWITTSVFFQVAVLAGYAYAHLAIRRLPPRLLIVGHATLAMLAIIALRPHDLLQQDGAAHLGASGMLVTLLAKSVGASALLVASTSPLIQALLARARLSPNPYLMYIASNGGSLAALFAYPAVLETQFGLGAQATLLRALLAGALLLTVACTLVAHACAGRDTAAADPTRVEPAEPAHTPGGAPRAATRQAAMWFLLAMVPSMLLSGMTLHITTDVVAAPLFWVVPLALYLVSFMVAFSRYGERWVGLAKRVALLVSLILICFMRARVASLFVIAPHLLLLFAGATAAHAELARLRPPPADLTRFYLVTSLGGAAGGAFCSLLAPRVFRDLHEYPLAIVLLVMLLAPRERGSWKELPIAAVGFGAATFGFGMLSQKLGLDTSRSAALVFGPVVLGAFVVRERRYVMATALAASLLIDVMLLRGDVLFADRNFFGVLRVQTDASRRFVAIVNGTTSHGLEDTERPGAPLAYYDPTGPAGDVLETLNAESRVRSGTDAEGRSLERGRKVEVIGLGIGALSAYAQPFDQWVYYEINPLDVQLAQDTRFFHALSRAQGHTEIVLGDARLELRQHPAPSSSDTTSRKSALLVVDAFSSDMIPMHLLTSEAVALYAARSDVVLFHLSNRFADLVPVAAASANAAGLRCRVRVDLNLTDEEADRGKRASIWLAATTSDALLQSIASRNAEWVEPRMAAKPWTDDRADIVSVLKFRE
jgi:hypothetical protein